MHANHMLLQVLLTEESFDWTITGENLTGMLFCLFEIRPSLT